MILIAKGYAHDLELVYHVYWCLVLVTALICHVWYLIVWLMWTFLQQSIAENKLKAFNIGNMNLKKGRTKKEQEEIKKKVCIYVRVGI